MRITIRDVAKQANVSQATVSLVLNQSPGVSPETRKRVSKVIEELNYRPDALARSFSSRRAGAVALVMPPTINSLADPYFMHLLQGALEAVRDTDYKLLIEIADSRFANQKLWDDLFQRRRVDGLMIATPYLDQAYLREISGCGHPTLLINGARADLPLLDFVGYDDVRCGVEATYYLLGLGHRRIAHLTGPENQASAVNRLQGYQDALTRARIAVRKEDILIGDYVRETGEKAMKNLLARPVSNRPTALFCANDTMAIAAMKVAIDAGLRIPQDISIIGVDDTGAAENAVPALTTYRQDILALSQWATMAFIKKLDLRSETVLQERLPMTLIERETCGPPAQTKTTRAKS